MRSSAVLRCASKVWFGALFALLFAARTLYAQGGEPQDFAIRGAKVVPVSGAPLENATVVISRGIITAIGKEVSIPAEAWVIDGKGREKEEPGIEIFLRACQFVNPCHERFRRGRGILPWRPNEIRSFDTFSNFKSYP